MKSGLIIFNTLAVTLRTDDAGHWTQDTGRRTQDAGHCPPTTLYYKLTGELRRPTVITVQVTLQLFGLPNTKLGRPFSSLFQLETHKFSQTDKSKTIVIVVFTSHVPVFFWPSRHDSRDIELKFCFLS